MIRRRTCTVCCERDFVFSQDAVLIAELERQIRELTLREPGESMDQRVLSLIHGSGDAMTRENTSRENDHVDQVSASMLKSRNSNTSRTDETTPIRRGVFSATFAGVLAALLIGIVVGNALPSLWTVSERSTASVEKQESPAHPPLMPSIPEDVQDNTDVRDTLKNVSAVGSQIVESTYPSAIAGAVLWERQNGEIFSALTHVSDRRFDMCRDCHRVGG